jgi:hypothetical protein
MALKAYLGSIPEHFFLIFRREYCELNCMTLISN